MALDSFLDIRPQIDWEIIVVDNNSSDDLHAVLSDYLDKIPLRLVEENRQGLIHARWKAVHESQFEIILFCDDDNMLSQNYIEQGFFFLASNSNVGVLAGQGEPVFGSTKPEWFEAHKNFYAVGSLERLPGKQLEGDLVYGAGLFFRKQALIELEQKGFENQSTGRNGKSLSGGEDLELTLGVMLLGYEYWYDDTLVFKHFIESHRLTWEYYLRLSKSIASSYPLIESFKLSRYETSSSLKLALWKNQFSLVKNILVVGLKGIKHGGKRYESRSKYLQAQFLAFFKNYNRTVRNFELLKNEVFVISKL
jgi:glycosyltransferase involved in cell wall biosynthesis